jgi:hypothetical protein
MVSTLGGRVDVDRIAQNDLLELSVKIFSTNYTTMDELDEDAQGCA